MITKLDQVINRKGYRHKWLAEKLNISDATLYNYRNGRTSMSVPIAKKLSIILGVKLDEIIE